MKRIFLSLAMTAVLMVSGIALTIAQDESNAADADSATATEEVMVEEHFEEPPPYEEEVMVEEHFEEPPPEEEFHEEEMHHEEPPPEYYEEEERQY